ncbi:hypothetical protein M9H77_30529 [Catharanthus roseus]|uniref:Uncharacterized protein n=1 Tax=Catharanthus roseus TaxID=4058 RepID=A0ACC0A050_CATRO|nr:hypothetical protein M9H77_30529 [Catharanthus roseus]
MERIFLIYNRSRRNSPRTLGAKIHHWLQLPETLSSAVGWTFKTTLDQNPIGDALDFLTDTWKLSMFSCLSRVIPLLEKILEEIIHLITNDLMIIYLLKNTITSQFTTLINFMKVDFKEDHKLEVEKGEDKVEEDIIDHEAVPRHEAWREDNLFDDFEKDSNVGKAYHGGYYGNQQRDKALDKIKWKVLSFEEVVIQMYSLIGNDK